MMKKARKMKKESMLILFVSVGINTLTVYVPDRTHIKLKAIKINTLIGFGWENEENHKIEKR